ncbi:MAG: hypothetical protein ACKOHG_00755 [Planctomycetia bacterium]
MTTPEEPGPKVADPYQTLAGPHPSAAGANAPRFHVLRPHATGNLGEVFVAHDAELHREVALKQIQSGHAHDPESRRRFLVEAEITGRLEHPGIVPVYSLGATLYHLLAGQPPFRGDDLGQVLRDVQAGRYPSPRMIQPQVPRALESIAAKAMAREPADRHMTAAALADDVEHWLAVSAEHDVVRFDVAMNHPAAVRVVDRLADDDEASQQPAEPE